MSAEMSAKRFRIAFSFAGEKRDYVAQVAAILAKRFGEAAILYDKYHEAEFARSDLGIYLPDLYHKESDFVVVVICPDYERRIGAAWSGRPSTLSQGSAKSKRSCSAGSIAPTVKGLYSTAGFIELDDKTPEQAAALILERLA